MDQIKKKGVKMANKKTNENQEIQEEQNPVDESKNSEN